jgi:oligoribonuclease NrnB/cAMP/cGMP phosphodiesterase (DHH superfamily)
MYKKLVLTHHNCTDGCVSRAIFEQVLGGNASYRSVDHSETSVHLGKEKYEQLKADIAKFKDTTIYMADLCLPIELIDLMLAQNNNVVILDHHASSVDTVEELRKRNDPRITIDFEAKNARSGALIAWQHVHPDVKPPKSVEYVSDGDLYAFVLGDETKHFYQGLNTVGASPADRSPDFYLALLQNPVITKRMVEVGSVAYEAYRAEVEQYAAKAFQVRLNDIDGLAVEAPGKFKSDVGNLLAKQSGTFGAVVEEKSDSFTISLRSVAPYSIKELAEYFNGGGHHQAAAFRLSSRAQWEVLVQTDAQPLRARSVGLKA